MPCQTPPRGVPPLAAFLMPRDARPPRATTAPRARIVDRQLRDAVLAGDVRGARRALAAGANPSQSSRAVDRASLLHDALALNQEGLAVLLLAAGADVTARAENGKTALHGAAHLGSVRLVRLFLTAGADASGRSHRDHTPFDLAIRAGHAPTALVLLKAYPGAIRAHDLDPWTLVHHAAFRGHQACLSLLLRRGMDPNTVDAQGRTPLVYAVDSDQATPEVLALLLARGAHPDGVPRTPQHETPLSCAIERSAYATAVQLLAAGASCTPSVVREVDASTPESLHFLLRHLRTAVRRGRIAVTVLAPLLSSRRPEVRTGVLLLLGTTSAAPRACRTRRTV